MSKQRAKTGSSLARQHSGAMAEFVADQGLLRAPIFDSLPWLRHGFSTRSGGHSQAYGANELNLGFTEHDDRSTVERNRAAFIRRLAGGDWPLATLRQAHSAAIVSVESSAAPAPLVAADGLLTQQTGILLAIQAADCLPILLAAPEARAVGALHAGWRGTLARIAEKGAGEMRRRYGCAPEKMLAAIGPGIHACCYTVGGEVREQFASQFAYAAELFSGTEEPDGARKKYPLRFMRQSAPGHGQPPPQFRLDLVEANRRQLLAAGLQAGNITAARLCTCCRIDLFFSHRAQHGDTGRMMAAIGIAALDSAP